MDTNCNAKELGSFPNRRKPQNSDGGTTLNSTSTTQFDYSVPEKVSSVKYNRATTMKEYEEQLEALRTENYNLRLRIYNMDEKINDEKNCTKKSHSTTKVSFDDQQCESSDLNDSHSENDKDLNCLEFNVKENKCCNVNIRAFKTIQELLKVNKRIMKINCQLKKQLETKLASNKTQVDSLDNSSSCKCDGSSTHSSKKDTTGKMCTEISDLQTELNEKRLEITQLQSQLDSLKLLESEEILSLRSKLVLKDTEINKLNQQVKKLHYNLQELVNTELWEKNKEISKLILKEAERKQLVDSASKNVVAPTPSVGEGQCKMIYDAIENGDGQQLMSYTEVNQLIEKIGNLSTILQTNDDTCATNGYEQLRNRCAQASEELEALKWKQKETAKLCANLSTHLDELSVFLDVVGTNFSESKSLKNEIHRMVKRNQQISKTLVELCFKGGSSGVGHNVPVLPDYSEINFFSCDEMSPSEEVARSAERTTSIFGKHFGTDSIETRQHDSSQDELRRSEICGVAKGKIADEPNGSDNWSEPDKHVSSARIGLACTFPVLHTESDSSVDNPKEIKHKRQRKLSNNNRVSIKITKEEYKKLKSALQFFTKYSRMLFENSAYERDMEKLVLVNSYLREINEKNMAKIQRLTGQMKSNVPANCGQDLSATGGDDAVERLKADNRLVCAQLQRSKEVIGGMQRQLDVCRAAESELVRFKETYCAELGAKLEAEVQNKFDIFCRNYEILCCLVEKTVMKITKMEEAVKRLSANCDGVARLEGGDGDPNGGDVAGQLEHRLNSVTQMLESARCDKQEADGHVSYLNDVITCKSKLIEAYQEQKKTLESNLAELQTELSDTAVALSMRERENKELYLILLEYEKDKGRADAEAVSHAEQMDRVREDHRLEMLKLTEQMYEYRKEEEGTFTVHMNVLDEIPKQIELLKLNKQKWQEMFEKSENDKNHFKSMLELILNLNESKTQCFVDGQTANRKETTDQALF
ncbi:centrosomin [Adelges cooleyi]|uniref:centrosomin n=1 Tax=Adelges cooleyi TaxID=133065 RepID=UPI00217FDF1F|nr:centrosomin [Adelges cooleyi]